MDRSSPPARGAGVSIRIQNVRREFGGGVVALDGIDLHVSAGEFLALLGPSGCGKSTLLRLIAGLDRPQAGTVEVTGPTEDDAAAAPIAFVFQDAHLLPWRNLLGNVALPLELMRIPSAQRRGAVARALEMVGLRDAAERYPAQLSGGMRMRGSLARAMVTRPRLLLLDEPFAALDEITRHHLDEQLRRLWQQTGMTVVFVTHSTTEAAFLADRAVVLSRRPGRVVEDLHIDLPPHRTALLRGAAAFANETRLLYEALERGGA